MIAAVSLLVTYEINKSQAINARTIADAQIESAKSMAEAQRDHTARLAEAELEVQRLKQIDDIFQKIIANGESSADSEAKKMLIGSLTVHRETSLPFLVRIRDHFAEYRPILQQLHARPADESAAIALTDNDFYVKMTRYGEEVEKELGPVWQNRFCGL